MTVQFNCNSQSGFIETREPIKPDICSPAWLPWKSHTCHLPQESTSPLFIRKLSIISQQHYQNYNYYCQYCGSHQGREGWTLDHTRWIYAHLEVCPEDLVAFSSKADITTDIEVKTVTSSTTRIHDPRDTAVSATKLQTTILEHARSSRETFTQLLADVISNAPIEVCAELGNSETNNRSLRWHRTQTQPEIQSQKRSRSRPAMWINY